MTNETTEQIEPTAETIEQPTLADVMKAITDLSRKVDEHKRDADMQFEAIRQGIVTNSVSYDRLKAEVILLRADVKELSEEVRSSRKALV